MKKNIGLIGNGSWGTALSKILTDNGHHVHWWVRNHAAIENLKKRHHNPHYLTSVYFPPERISPTADVGNIFSECDTIIFAVPSAFVEDVIEQTTLNWIGKKIISAIKGILPKSYLLLNDYLHQHFDVSHRDYFAITGPCHAEEVAQERLSYLTFSGLEPSATAEIAGLFQNDYIQSRATHDLWGSQYAAILKNIYAIGAGIAHALDYGDNFLSVYITNCYREMCGFMAHHFDHVHPSKEPPDFLTSPYLGDLLVTCYSLHSRNRTFGTMIGKGYSVKAAILEMNMIAEGYYAARGIGKIAKQFQIPVPIAAHIRDILWEDKPPKPTFSRMESLFI